MPNNISYRNRGKQVRNLMRINNIRTKIIFKLNKKESNIEKKIIEEYSDKKIKQNHHSHILH